MKNVRFMASTAMIIAALGLHGALALTVDDSSGVGKGSAANLSDPDDKIPYPHVADDGSQSQSNFQGQQVDNTGLSLSVAPASNGALDDAFQRAQQRMQQ